MEDVKFWNSVLITDNSNDCWLWTKGLNKDGYGKVSRKRLKQQHWQTHRYAYFLTYGEIPNSLMVCHSCDIRSCCNPKHLFLGTNQTNMDDMVQKRRSASGERNRNSKLLTENIRILRKEYKDLVAKFIKEAQKRYEISDVQIGNIIYERGWKE